MSWIRDTPDVRVNSLTRLSLTAYDDHVVEGRPAGTAPEVALGEGDSVTLNVVEARSSRDLRSFAFSLGYTDELLADQFPVWLPGRVVRPDLVGFGSPPFNMNTATLVAQALPEGDNAKRDLFAVAETLSAPAAVTLTEESLDIWWLGAGAYEPSKLGTVLRNELLTSSFAASTAGRSLAPQALLQAKRGTVQPSLFPLDIGWIEQSRGHTENRLEELVTHSVVAAYDTLAGIGQSLPARELARLVLAAFTLSFIRDRFNLSVGSKEWNLYLQTVHPHLYSWMSQLKAHENVALTKTINDLSSTVNLAALDPALMSGVYERSLVSEEERSELGVVYTPAELARRMLANLPIEELPPDERRVLDPTCGSGTLLLAAHDRLRDLVSARVGEEERHRWLVGHLSGWDKDPFAVEVARLCLTINALPDGNGWHVEQADALGQEVPDAARPTIIVSNPPWKAHRTGPTGSRLDLASVFLDWSLSALAPEGMLGILLPGGWLTSDYSARSRRRVREDCEVLEVWRLPERTFRHGEAAPAILLAKKTKRAKRLHHIERRVIHRESLARLYMQGVADSTTLVQTTAAPGEKADREAAFMARPLTGRVSSSPWPKYLGDVARLRSGPTRHRGAQKGAGSYLLADGLSRKPYFSLVRRESCSPVRWPEDFDAKSSGNPADYSAQKLLLTGKMRPDSPWSSRVRVDLLGVVPTDAYIMVIPQAEQLPHNVSVSDALFALTAICGSAFASAWIDERRSTRNIPPALFRDLPLPEGWFRLARSGRQLVQAAGDIGRLTSLVAEVDASVATLYGLDDIEFDALRARYAGIVAPEGVVRFRDPPSTTATTPTVNALCTYGAVLDMTPADIRLWAPGLTNDEGDVVTLPPRFLGSLLYAGADFSVRADLGGLRYGEFQLHASAWKSPLLTVTDEMEHYGVEGEETSDGFADDTAVGLGPLTLPGPDFNDGSLELPPQ